MTRQSLAICFFSIVPGSVLLILYGLGVPKIAALFVAFFIAFAAFGVAMEKSGIGYAVLAASSAAVYAAIAPLNAAPAFLLYVTAILFSAWCTWHAARNAHEKYGASRWFTAALFNLPMAVFISVLYSVALNFPLAAYVALGVGALISLIAAWASKRYNIFSERVPRA
ncbi:MAG: hypothetical protein HYS74_02475 [Parcubacteria group bacterium]|nr:hypothetical protein [Parcubacteria group bacterium]